MKQVKQVKQAMSLMLVLAAGLASGAAGAGDISSAQRDADKIAAATVAKNFAGVAEFTHPLVVKRAGGAAAMVKQLDTAYAEITINSMKFGKPEQITDVDGTLIGVFPFREKVTVKGKSVEVPSFYIGFAADKEHWKFIDCEGVTQEYLAALLPGYHNHLKLHGC